MTRLLAVVVIVGAALLGSAGPALAHNTLISTDPADGAQLTVGPQRITLTFDQPVQSGFDTITVTGPDNTAWATGEAATSGNTASIDVLPLGPAGAYTVGYRVVSADGHPVSGSVRFLLTQAGTGTPAPPTTDAGTAGSGGGGGLPVWPWIVAAVVLVGAGVAAALRLGRPPS